MELKTKIVKLKAAVLTIIRLGLLWVAFSGGINLTPSLHMSEDLIWYQYNLIQLLINIFKVY